MPNFRGVAPYVCALLSGLLLLVAMPGSGSFWPMVLVGLIPLFYTVQVLSGRKLALTVLLAGFVHYSFQMYWIVNVLKQYGGLHIIIAVAALMLLAVYMSLYLILFALAARLVFRKQNNFCILWMLPLLWVGLDWLRSWLFTGLPWMDLGYALAGVPRLIQLADITGHFGITFLVVQLNLFFFLCLQRLYTYGEKRKLSFLRDTLPIFCLLLAVGIYSGVRYKNMTNHLAGSDLKQLNVGIVQGNIDQNLKWNEKLQRHSVDKYLNLTQILFKDDSPQVVVWPETALPFYPTRSRYTEMLKSATEYYDFSLITGAPWFEIIDLEKKKVNYYNSALMLTPDGTYAGSYHKSHLVPFGEYVPFKKFFPFIQPLVEAAGDFTAGSVEHPLKWNESRAGLLICFESIFPEISRKWVASGANYLVNLTNDAWYGFSSAPHHTLAMTVFRAVETRRNLVRSANTGISGIIDARGELLERSPLFKPWAAARKIALLEEKTIFVKYGYLFAPFSFLLSVSFFFFLLLKRKTDSGN